MNRILNLMNYALTSILRRWKKNLALIIIYAGVVGFFSSIVLFTSALKYESQNTLSALPELWMQKLAGGRLQPMPVETVDSLQIIRGIQRVIPRYWGYYYDSPTGAVFTIIGSDSAVSGLYDLKTEHTGKLDDSSAVCGTGFMQMHHLQIGDRLNLIDAKGILKGFQIVGQFTASSDLLTNDLIILSTASAQNILGLAKGYCTDIAVRISNSSEVENIALKINRKYYGLRVVSKEDLLLTYDALFSWRGGIFVFGGLISLLAFLILAWDRASGLSRDERKELGILKGIGWQINDVLLLKFFEGIMISVTAALLGILASLFHIFIFDAWLIKPFFIGWSILYPDYDLRIVIDCSSLLLVFLISVIPYLTASVIPAWKAAITDPAEVIQE
ncbi:MAG: ABC transporter permease [Calditrichaceae bacterium]|nr:ABC transporter permease [Calditrichaceae bacterium]